MVRGFTSELLTPELRDGWSLGFRHPGFGMRRDWGLRGSRRRAPEPLRRILRQGPEHCFPSFPKPGRRVSPRGDRGRPGTRSDGVQRAGSQGRSNVFRGRAWPPGSCFRDIRMAVPGPAAFSGQKRCPGAPETVCRRVEGGAAGTSPRRGPPLGARLSHLPGSRAVHVWAVRSAGAWA